MNGAFRPKGGNGVHGLFDDAKGECHEVTRGFNRGGLKPVTIPDETNRFSKGSALRGYPKGISSGGTLRRRQGMPSFFS